MKYLCFIRDSDYYFRVTKTNNPERRRNEIRNREARRGLTIYRSIPIGDPMDYHHPTWGELYRLCSQRSRYLKRRGENNTPWFRMSTEDVDDVIASLMSKHTYGLYYYKITRPRKIYRSRQPIKRSDEVFYLCLTPFALLIPLAMFLHSLILTIAVIAKVIFAFSMIIGLVVGTLLGRFYYQYHKPKLIRRKIRKVRRLTVYIDEDDDDEDDEYWVDDELTQEDLDFIVRDNIWPEVDGEYIPIDSSDESSDDDYSDSSSDDSSDSDDEY